MACLDYLPRLPALIPALITCLDHLPRHPPRWQADAQSFQVFTGITHKECELAAASQRSDAAASASATYRPDVTPLLRASDGGALWAADRPTEVGPAPPRPKANSPLRWRHAL